VEGVFKASAAVKLWPYILRGRGNNLKHFQNILLILLLVVAALTVFGLSFKMGEMIFIAYKSTAKAPLPENIPQNSREMSSAAVAPKADKPIEPEEAKSGANESAPIKMADPAPREVEKVGNTGMKKNMILMPAENFSPPAGKEEKPAAEAKPEVPAPAVKPAATASEVSPEIKPPKPAPKQETATRATKKRKEYKVVAASFSKESGTDQLIDRLKAENYKPIVVQANVTAGRFYRVIVGSHGSLSEAHGQMAELKKLGLKPFCIVE
jgi:cell division septation protein DedD